MSQDPDQLARQLQALQDVEEIKKLKARYIEACDGGWGGKDSHNTDRIVALFTEHCVWDGGAFGKRESRAALRDYYERNAASGPPPAAYHILSSPIIEVDGDRATGIWHLTIFLGMGDGSSTLVGGAFNDEYRRTPEGWRIQYSRFALALTGRHEGAWTFPG